jgi:hypothetical protein
MPTITTTNALSDFDLCLALAQNSTNSQMKHSWAVWNKKRGFQDKIEVFKTKKSGKIVDSKYGISAVVATPTVDLNVPDAKLAQVKVTLPLQSGKVVYRDDDADEMEEYPIKDWRVSFFTSLDKRPVDFKVLDAIDPGAASSAKKFLEKSPLPDSVFSIEYLFLKLTEVDLMLAGNQNIHIPDTVPFAARNRALIALTLLLQGEIGEFAMGTVLRRRQSAESLSTFALTDFVFDVRSNPSVATASTLNYFGMLAQTPLPKDVNAARLKFEDSWVRPSQLDGTESTVSGVMAITSRSFLDKYLIPKFRAAFRTVPWESVLGTPGIGRTDQNRGPDVTRNSLQWTLSEKIKTGVVKDDLIGQITMRLDQGYSVIVTVHPSKTPEQISIQGRIDCKIHVEGAPSEGAKPTHQMDVNGHQNFSGALTLTGSGIATDFNLEAKSSDYKFDDAVIDHRETKGVNFGDLFSGALKVLGLPFKTNEELYAEAQKQTTRKLVESMKGALSLLDADLKQHCFIPQGGGVFTFQNPCFSNAGDLFLDVIYQRS